MIGPAIRRELARQHNEEIARRRHVELARDAARPRTRQPALLSEALPAVSVVAGIVLALAIGAPVSP